MVILIENNLFILYLHRSSRCLYVLYIGTLACPQYNQSLYRAWQDWSWCAYLFQFAGMEVFCLGRE